MAKIRIKLTGKRFGKLLVLREYVKADGQHMVTCLCDCGSIGEYPRRRVRSGDTRSCGCLKRETAREAVAKYKGKRADGLEKYRVEDTSLISIGIPKKRPGTQTERKGVNVSKGRYVAKITLNKVLYTIGTYDTFAEAERRRSIAEELLHEPVKAMYEAGLTREETNRREYPTRDHLVIAVDCQLSGMSYDNLIRDYYFASDIVDKYNLPRPTIYSWRARGRIHEPDYLQIDSINMYRKEWVDAWVEKKRKRDANKKAAH